MVLGASLLLGLVDGVVDELVLGVGVGVVPVSGAHAADCAASAAAAVASRLASSAWAC